MFIGFIIDISKDYFDVIRGIDFIPAVLVKVDFMAGLYWDFEHREINAVRYKDEEIQRELIL